MYNNDIIDDLLEKIKCQDELIKVMVNDIQALKKIVYSQNNSIDNNNQNEDDNIIQEDVDTNEDDGYDENISTNDNYLILKNKHHAYEDECINLINQIYKIGIKFTNLLDTNCLDNKLVNYLKERDYPVKGLSLYKQTDYCDLTDINLSDIEDNSYNLVSCFNLFQYLNENDIKTYYKNLIRISNSFIIIIVDFSKNQLDYYFNLFNEVVNLENENEELKHKFIIQRFVTNNLPQNYFILKKEIILK